MPPSLIQLQAYCFHPGHSEQVFSQAMGTNLKINQAASQFHVAPLSLLFIGSNDMFPHSS